MLRCSRIQLAIQSLFILLSLAILTSQLFAQNATTISMQGVPRVIKFSGVLKDASGKLLKGVQGITFAIYADETGGAPLWQETQNISFSQGKYNVLLGATTSTGLPPELFSSGQSQWLGVRIGLPDEQEQPRVQLASVPYALKAVDADTLGGLPASAFLRGSGNQSIETAVAASISSNTAGKGTGPLTLQNVQTNGGTVGTIPEFKNSSTEIENSPLQDSAGEIITPNMENVLYADQYCGTSPNFHTCNPSSDDIGIAINNAYNALPATGGRIRIAAGTYAKMMTGVRCDKPFKPCLIEGDSGGATTLMYGAGTGVAFLFDWGTSQTLGNGTNFFTAGGLRDVTITGPGVTVGATGIWMGPNAVTSNGLNQAVISGVAVTGFYTCVEDNTVKIGNTVYSSFLNTIEKSSLISCHQGLYVPAGCENLRVIDSVIARNALGIYAAGAGDLYLMNNSFDDNNIWIVNTVNKCTSSTCAAIRMDASNGSGFHIHGFGNHFENAGGGLSQYVIQNAGHLELYGGTMSDDGSNGQDTNTEFVTTSCCDVVLDGVAVWSGAGSGGPQHNLLQAVNMTNVGNAILHLNNLSHSNPATIPFEYNTSYKGGSVWNQGMESDLTTMNANMSGYNLTISGTLTAGNKNFKIDDPLNPANKYLYHTSVESPDMMNIYNGNVTTNNHGYATVTLPKYFEALNQDYRYQLTVLGSFSRATVAKEIRYNRFTIHTTSPKVRVSWQVTGIRHDAYAEAHRSPVEVDKPEGEKGHYLHPELFGASSEQRITRQKASSE